MFFFIMANAQEDAPQTPVQMTEVEQLLNKAKSLQNADQKMSTKLANEVLLLSEKNNDHNIRAQTHSLLGELALKSENIIQSMEHYLQASLIYKKMDDKRYDEADKVIDQLQSVAQQFKVTLPIAKILISKADSDYKKKHYDDAIVQYIHALTYLLEPDKKEQKKRGETYKKIAQSYKRLKNRELTVLYYKKALEVFTALQDLKNMARTLNTLAEAERYLGHYEVSLDYSMQGLEISKQIDDPKGLANALTGMGIIYRYIGLYEESLDRIYQAHLYYNEVNDPNGIAKTSNQMGLIYTRLKQFEQARSFYQLTINLPKNKIKSKTLASALREMAVINLNAGDYQLAKEMAQKASEIYKTNKDKLNQSLIARIIGNIYREEHDIDQAIVYYRESLSIATKIGNKTYQIKAQTPLAAMLLKKDTDEAMRLLNEALTLATEIDSNSQILYAYRELRKMEKERGNYQESLRYAEQEILFTKIIQKERDDNELAIVKAKLYSHSKEMELASLREKAKFNQLELAKKNNEIEIGEQARVITELELIKNKYASIALALLLAVCMLLILIIYRRFVVSKKRNKELDLLAALDPLTNCYNRRILFERMERDFENAQESEEYCIIMIDIDHFKSVNDTYGHSAGDSVLCGVASILQDCIRQKDMVARFGGEEFCIVLHNVTQSKAVYIAEKMRDKVSKSRFEDIPVTCSFGVTSIKFNATTAAGLIDQADLALYESKSQGRNKVTLWNKKFDDIH